MRISIFTVFIIGATSLLSVNMNLAVDYLNMEWMVNGPNVWNNYTDTGDPHQGYTEAHPCDWVDGIGTTITGMPYHYGGKDSFAQWDNDYVNGNNGPGAHTIHYQINSPTSREWAAGIDCSGFVGRCWGISEVSIGGFGCGHIRDNYPNIAPHLVQPGDAFVASTHARLCYGRYEDDPTNQWVEVIEAMSDGVNKVEKNIYRIEDMIASGFGCYSCSDSTNISAGSVSGTWTLEDGPYLIGGDIQVDTTATLTIEAGVNVIFTGHYKFTIYGKLLAQGTEDMNIFFTAENTIAGWGGLRFINNNTNEFDQSRLTHCKIEYGNAQGNWPDNVGGGIFCQYSNTIIDTCVVTNNSALAGGGIYVNHSNPEIYYTLISENHAQEFGGGIAAYDNCMFFLMNNTIVDNTVDVSGNVGGGIFCDMSCWAYIVNTIVWGNTSYQVYLFYDRDYTINYCNIEDAIYPGDGNFSSDPLFNGSDPTHYELTSNSPCIDTGHPNYNDPDGTRSDVGAFPYFQLPEPPEVTISIQNNQVSLACGSVSRTSYIVYSSDDPEGTFTEDETGSFDGNVWTAPLTDDSRFYYVTTDTGSRRENSEVTPLSELINNHKRLHIQR